MDRKEFFNLPLNEQIDLLEKLQDSLNKLADEVDENRRNNYYRCGYCRKYYKKEAVEKVVDKQRHHEYVYTDCGYGDDDLVAEFEDTNLYFICPDCNERTFVERISRKEVGERKRKGEL